MRWSGVEWGGGYLYISASVVPAIDTLVTLHQFGGAQACMVYPNKLRVESCLIQVTRDVCAGFCRSPILSDKFAVSVQLLVIT